MRTIVFIVTSGEVGGAQRWVLDQVMLLQEDFEAIVVTKERGWLTEQLTRQTKAMVYHVKGLESYILPSVIFKLKAILAKHNACTIVASSASAGVYARFLGLITKIRVVYVSHGWSALYNFGKLRWIGAILEKLLSVMTDKILCVSSSDFELASKVIRIKNKKLCMITNGVFEANFPQIRDCLSVPRILCVSRLEHPKRVDLAIEAIKKTKYELYIVGNGSQYEALKSLANHSRRIKFLGETLGFNEFAFYDAFILLSESEGLPISAIEAMSAGLPLILSNVGGCAELIDRNGTLVSDDVDEIATAINSIVARASELGQGSKKLFHKKFNLKNKKMDYIKVYVG